MGCLQWTPVILRCLCIHFAHKLDFPTPERGLASPSTPRSSPPPPRSSTRPIQVFAFHNRLVVATSPWEVSQVQPAGPVDWPTPAPAAQMDHGDHLSVTEWLQGTCSSWLQTPQSEFSAGNPPREHLDPNNGSVTHRFLAVPHAPHLLGERALPRWLPTSCWPCWPLLPGICNKLLLLLRVCWRVASWVTHQT